MLELAFTPMGREQVAAVAALDRDEFDVVEANRDPGDETDAE